MSSPCVHNNNTEMSYYKVAERLAPIAGRAIGNYVAAKGRQYVVDRAREYMSGKRKGVSGANRPQKYYRVQSSKGSQTDEVKKHGYRRPIRRKYVTTGRLGKRFRKSRTTALNKFLKHGTVTKLESRIVVTDPECIYVGHYSLPPDVVTQTAWRAIARSVFAIDGQFLSDVNQQSEEGPIQVYVYYRDEFNGTLKSTTVVATGDRPTVSSLGDAIGAALLQGMGATDRYYEVVDLIFKTNAGANQMLKVSGNAIVLTVVGNSSLSIQNRTQAGTAVTPDNNILDITNNPLRGKSYDGWGNIHPYRFNNDTSVNGTKSMYYGPVNGLLYVGATDAELTSEMSESIKKPPPRGAFGGVKATSYVKIAPGEIRRSHVKTKLTMNVNQFIRLYMDYYRGQSSWVAAPNTNMLINRGSARFFGLEKVLETSISTEAVISVGAEVNTAVSCHARIYRSQYMNPKVEIIN